MTWFKHWFGSEFYDRLYDNRNDEEAVDFIHKVFRNLPEVHNPSILDLCCGNGRHAIAMSEYGSVTGVDLNSEQIAKAQARNIDNAVFSVHDMREIVHANHFDFVFNLFSSFAYFEDSSEDLKVLQSVYADLKANGIFVHDFLNADYVLPRLKHSEYKKDGDLAFDIIREYTNKKIIKRIKVTQDNRIQGIFEEKLTAYVPDEILAMHHKAGLQPYQVWGNYKLADFDKDNSPRIIILSKKNG
ncbi:MAG: class I SAM-dependent methyltransferase [Bacteroidia bacterium]|nr:class I SAM-dependent methyltransferase [Bacteroidia bacterium]MCO5254932.1 class I SAM-dependent methyltransferase [Bacteroidota bacterium]